MRASHQSLLLQTQQSLHSGSWVPLLRTAQQECDVKNWLHFSIKFGWVDVEMALINVRADEREMFWCKKLPRGSLSSGFLYVDSTYSIELWHRTVHTPEFCALSILDTNTPTTDFHKIFRTPRQQVRLRRRALCEMVRRLRLTSLKNMDKLLRCQSATVLKFMPDSAYQSVLRLPGWKRNLIFVRRPQKNEIIQYIIWCSLLPSHFLPEYNRVPYSEYIFYGELVDYSTTTNLYQSSTW